MLSLLRPGKRPSGDEAARVLRTRHRPHPAPLRPGSRSRCRGDGSIHGTPEVMDLLEDQGHGYIRIGLPGNARLSEIGQPWCEDAALGRVQSGKDKVRAFLPDRLPSQKLVTRAHRSLPASRPPQGGRMSASSSPTCRRRAKLLYERVYCARGRMENMIKEHKLYTKSDRTSCHRWEANQFRLFLHTAAYWLLHQLCRTAPRRSHVAHRNVRDATTGIPQDRRAHRGAQHPHQDRPAAFRPTHIATP